MWQSHALDFWDGAGIARPHREAADLPAVIQLIAHHVHRQPLVGASQDLKTVAVLVIVFDGGRHAVDKVVFFVEVLREKDPHAPVHICGGALQGPDLFQPLALIVFQVGLVVKGEGADGAFVAVLEESFHRNGVGLGAGLAAAGDDGGVIVAAEKLQDVVGRGIVGLPSTVPSENLLLELLHAGLVCPQDVQLVLQRGALAANLLPKGDGLDVVGPGLARITPGYIFLHHGQLPEIAQQNQTRQLVGILPHRQDALEVGRGEHRHLHAQGQFMMLLYYKRTAHICYDIKLDPAPGLIDDDKLILGQDGHGFLKRTQ